VASKGYDGRVAEFSLAGKAALVTGAAVRVGRAIALALADAGADVAVHYRSAKAQADGVVETVRSMGRRSVAIGADLADPEQCRRTVRGAIGSLGSLDVLVHSAANFHRASLAETDERLWDSAMDLNARAGYLLAREAASTLRERRGRVVLISDFLARDPARHYLAHAVSKAAVEGLVRALAVELAPEVSVNGVAPGTVLVPEGTSPEDAESLARRVPLRRNGDPEDVARTVLFLCAGPAFLTGQVIAVDGGKSLT
jgi:pteridine reductase